MDLEVCLICVKRLHNNIQNMYSINTLTEQTFINGAI